MGTASIKTSRVFMYLAAAIIAWTAGFASNGWAAPAQTKIENPAIGYNYSNVYDNVVADDDQAIIGLYTIFGNSAVLVSSTDAVGMGMPLQLLKPDTPVSDDKFGYALGLSGDYLLVGAPEADNSGTDSGVVYVFKRDHKGAWSQIDVLEPDVPAAGAQFGYAISTSNGYAAIGAIYEDDGLTTHCGAVYVFALDGDGNWTQEARLVPDTPIENGLAGSSVLVSTNTVAFSGTSFPDSTVAGVVYIFESDGMGNWTQADMLEADPGDYGNNFGSSLAISSNTLFIGSSSSNGNAFLAGAVYLFEKDGSGFWVKSDKVYADDGVVGDAFGSTLSILDNELAIGAIGVDYEGQQSGAVYVFSKDVSGNWVQGQKIIPINYPDSGGTGKGTCFSNGRILACAHQLAYVFGKDGLGTWEEKFRYLPYCNPNSDWFGYSIDESDDLIVVGAPKAHA
ncbi:MAG: FG-GAP repeat protein, partial [Candidatus Sumerlaeota bacterium]